MPPRSSPGSGPVRAERWTRPGTCGPRRTPALLDEAALDRIARARARLQEDLRLPRSSMGAWSRSVAMRRTSVAGDGDVLGDVGDDQPAAHGDVEGRPQAARGETDGADAESGAGFAARRAPRPANAKSVSGRRHFVGGGHRDRDEQPGQPACQDHRPVLHRRGDRELRSLAAYRTAVVRDDLDSYLNETFMGRRCGIRGVTPPARGAPLRIALPAPGRRPHHRDRGNHRVRHAGGDQLTAP